MFRNKFQIQATLIFQKTTLGYHLKEEKIGGHSSTFLGITPFFEMCKTIAKIQCYCNVLNLNQFNLF